MKRYLLLAFVLTGCANSGPILDRKFPEVPAELHVACGDLETIKSTDPKFSELLTTVTDNYSQYQVCRAKVDNWMQWYDSQKKIYEDVK